MATIEFHPQLQMDTYKSLPNRKQLKIRPRKRTPQLFIIHYSLFIDNKKHLCPYERDKGANLCGTTLFALRPLKLAL